MRLWNWRNCSAPTAPHALSTACWAAWPTTNIRLRKSLRKADRYGNPGYWRARAGIYPGDCVDFTWPKRYDRSRPYLWQNVAQNYHLAHLEGCPYHRAGTATASHSPDA